MINFPEIIVKLFSIEVIKKNSKTSVSNSDQLLWNNLKFVTTHFTEYSKLK